MCEAEETALLQEYRDTKRGWFKEGRTGPLPIDGGNNDRFKEY